MKRFIHEFFNELEINEVLSGDFDTHPEETMTDYGLDAYQRRLILQGTNQEIRAALKEEMKTHVAYVIRMG